MADKLEQAISRLQTLADKAQKEGKGMDIPDIVGNIGPRLRQGTREPSLLGDGIQREGHGCRGNGPRSDGATRVEDRTPS